MSMVDITNIDKVKLLEALWKNSQPAVFLSMRCMVVDFDKNKANMAVNKYIDYFCGRCIKTDLSTNTVNPYLYDRDYGSGKFQQIVNSLKNV
jgi:hypothetical protein